MKNIIFFFIYKIYNWDTNKILLQLFKSFSQRYIFDTNIQYTHYLNIIIFIYHTFTHQRQIYRQNSQTQKIRYEISNFSTKKKKCKRINFFFFYKIYLIFICNKLSCVYNKYMYANVYIFRFIQHKI